MVAENDTCRLIPGQYAQDAEHTLADVADETTERGDDDGNLVLHAEGEVFLDADVGFVDDEVHGIGRDLRLGVCRAGGGGFYDYPAGEKQHLWPELRALFEKSDVSWSVEEVQDRLLYRQAIETARCLAEGVLTSVHDANIGSIFGIGFPAWTGGAMQFIYSMGPDAFFKRAETLTARFGPGFTLTDAVKDSILQHQPQY